jgi:shikimate dehydrogenase
MINSNTKVVALIGNPSRHSLSPKIQNYLIENYNINAAYLVFEFPESNLKEAFYGAEKLGFKGLNVTMPYKEDVYKMVKKLDKNSYLTKSVNTVKFLEKSHLSIGYNTDVDGFLKSLKDKNFDWKNKVCLVIGAGGAAKSAVYGILKNPVKKLYLYNRTTKKIQEIMNIFKNISGKRIKAVYDLGNLKDEYDKIDLIVNCTPIGMDAKACKRMMPVPDDWNLGGKFIFDMVYNPVETKFIKKGIKDGAVIIRGIDMLVNQAIFSFTIWFNIMPDAACIRKIPLDNI